MADKACGLRLTRQAKQHPCFLRSANQQRQDKRHHPLPHNMFSRNHSQFSDSEISPACEFGSLLHKLKVKDDHGKHVMDSDFCVTIKQKIRENKTK